MDLQSEHRARQLRMRRLIARAQRLNVGIAGTLLRFRTRHQHAAWIEGKARAGRSRQPREGNVHLHAKREELVV